MEEINFVSPYTTCNRIKRLFWCITWNILARPFPKSFANRWKLFILRAFGAQIAKSAYVYSSANIFMPWNLIMEEHACIASGVDCYNAAPVIIKKMQLYHKGPIYVQPHIIFHLHSMSK